MGYEEPKESVDREGSVVKPEPLGAVERFKQLWDAYWEIKCCKHCDDKESHSVCDSCSIEFFSKGIREAEDALRKEMVDAALKQELEAIGRAVVVARREALEEACKAKCKWCHGESPWKSAPDLEVNIEPHEIDRQYIPNSGEHEGFIHHTSWGGVYACDADEIRRLMK